MELNLYGVASIQLDRLKGRRIRQVLLAFLAYYVVSIINAIFLPHATETLIFEGNDEHMSICPKQVDSRSTQYSIIVESASDQLQLEWFDYEQFSDTFEASKCDVAQYDLKQTVELNDLTSSSIVYEGSKISAFRLSSKNDLKVTVEAHTSSPYLALSIFKYANIVTVLITIYLFSKRLRVFQYQDLGVVQKWVMLLLIALVFYDDPLYPIKQYVFEYEICLSVFESTFIALMLFFWILVVHSIAQAEQLLNLNPLWFYQPKICLCLAIWLYLITEGIYTRDGITLISRLIGVALLVAYVVYFTIIAYSVLQLTKQMKKAYKTLVQVTIGVISVSLVLLLTNGQLQQYESPVIYVAQYSLFNAYMLMVAFLYSPCSTTNKQPNKHQKPPLNERNEIMTSFYEMEMPELDDAEKEDLVRNKQDQQQQYSKRRDIKQDPKDKAKERLWASIVDAAANDEDESSDSDGQI